MKLARKLAVVAVAALSGASFAQVPDLMTAIDAGGRAMGAGSAFNLSSISTLSATYNPAALGYVTRPEIGAAMRTLPDTKTSVAGALNDLRLSSDTETGSFRASHVGLAFPLKQGSNRGAVGVAWTIGGWFHDIQRGVGLDNGVATFEDFTRARTDFVNLSYGKASGDQSIAWGFGLVVAQQNVRVFQRTTFTDNNIPPVVADTDETSHGVGAQIGFMLTPKGRPDVTIAASARSPIELNGGSSLYDRIPGRLAAGIAARKDGYRGGRDYAVLGIEVQHFFDGNDSPRLDRENQTTAHFGVEYNYSVGSAIIPLRIGYSLVPRGGTDFDNRNTFNYGFGYRPKNGDWTIELNFGSPNGGGKETGVFLSYRFK